MTPFHDELSSNSLETDVIQAFLSKIGTQMVTVKHKNVCLMNDYSFHLVETAKHFNQIRVLDLILDVTRTDSNL